MLLYQHCCTRLREDTRHCRPFLIVSLSSLSSLSFFIQSYSIRKKAAGFLRSTPYAVRIRRFLRSGR